MLFRALGIRRGLGHAAGIAVSKPATQPAAVPGCLLAPTSSCLHLMIETFFLVRTQQAVCRQFPSILFVSVILSNSLGSLVTFECFVKDCPCFCARARTNPRAAGAHCELEVE